VLLSRAGFPAGRDGGLWLREAAVPMLEPGREPAARTTLEALMTTSRWRVLAGIVSLLGAGLGQLAQFAVAPAHLSGGSAAEQVAAAAEHGTRMQVSVWLDVPILLIIPAALYLGHIARAQTSRLAATGAALTFGGALGVGYLLAGDLLMLLAAHADDRDGAVALVDALQAAPVFNLMVVAGVLGTTVGLLLLGIALVRARTVPVWAGLAVAAGPLLTVAGEASGVGAVAIAAYAAQFAGFAACAVRLARPPATTPAVMTPAAV
jgi:hypothetical protein